MSSEWPTYRLEECLDALIDYRGKTPIKTSSGIPLITAKVIKNGRIEKPTEFIALENYDTWMRRGIPISGDVVLTVEAPLGEVAQLGPEKIALAQRVVTLRGKANVLDSTYLLFMLQCEEMQEQLKSRATGTTVIGIKQSELRKVIVKLPPYKFQIEVASMLKSIDDCITTLRETNVTLEAMAQAMFKSWFVDFDPVHAKLEGRVPEGMDEATAALFPDSFEESELGAIPSGWKAVPFGKLLCYTIGGDWGSDAPNDKDYTRVAIIRGTDIPDLKFGTIGRVPIRYTTQKKLTGRKLEVGDIVIEVSGGTKDQPTGRALYVTAGLLRHFDCPIETASFCRLFRPTSKNIGILLSQQLTYIYAQGKMWGYQNQSTGIANFQTTHFLEAEMVLVPSDELLAKFSEAVGAMMMGAQEGPIQELAALRDTLLPRLVSGQLRIPESPELALN